MSIFFTVLSVASSAMQAISTYNQGMAMKAYYDAQADVSRLQYKTKVVEAREQGVRALKENNKVLNMDRLFIGERIRDFIYKDNKFYFFWRIQLPYQPLKLNKYNFILHNLH